MCSRQVSRKHSGSAAAFGVEPNERLCDASIGAVSQEGGTGPLPGKVRRTKNSLRLHDDDVDLDEYLAGKTPDGLFFRVAEEEKSIRHNPAARSTEVVKKVFGA